MTTPADAASTRKVQALIQAEAARYAQDEAERLASDAAARSSLLPCPFCGATDDDNDLRRVIGYEYENCWIECDKCGAQGPHVTIKTLPRGVSTEDFIKAKNLVDDEASAAAAAAWNQRGAWQPIETAPRDGTKILAWDGQDVKIARTKESCSNPPSKFWVYTDEELTYYDYSPTHWQPLPSPPPITP